MGRVRGHTGRRQHLLGARGQVAQAGPDVLAVVVTLLLVEGGLSSQALERGLELHQLCLPPLPVSALVTDVLGLGNQGRGSWPFLAGEPQGLTQAQEQLTMRTFGKRRKRGISRLFLLGGAQSRGLSQPSQNVFRAFPTEE